MFKNYTKIISAPCIEGGTKNISLRPVKRTPLDIL